MNSDETYSFFAVFTDPLPFWCVQVFRRLLEEKGHKLIVPKGSFSIMMGINRREGRVYANADFRKRGAVDGE